MSDAATAEPARATARLSPLESGRASSSVDDVAICDDALNPVVRESVIVPAASLAGPIERAQELGPAARPIRIDAADAWSVAGERVLRVQFACLLSRLPGVLACDDPADLHAMRVASRRMRAAWRVFGDGLARQPMHSHRRELRELGAQLGVVRDLDVGLRTLDSHVAARGSRTRTAVLPLWNAWSRERSDRQGELVRYLTSPAFVEFVLETEAFLDHPAPTATAAGRPVATVRSRMPAMTWAAYGAVRAFEGRVAVPGGPDLAARHDLRIATKWLRYTLEFAAEPFGDHAARLSAPVIALQDNLGDQLDLAATITLLRAYIDSDVTRVGNEVAHLERVSVALVQRMERSADSLPRAWSGVSSRRYRARLGRALEAL